MGLTIDRNLSFLHRFEGCRLSSGRGSVDLVNKYNIGEQRPWLEFPSFCLATEHCYACQVCWEKIGRTLNPSEGSSERLGESFGEQGLAHSRNVFNQKMSAGKKSRQS